MKTNPYQSVLKTVSTLHRQKSASRRSLFFSCAIRSSLLGILFLLMAAFTGCTPPSGDSGSYPSKTVVIICPWAAGGGTDAVSRHLATQLHQEFGQPFVVVNKTGGSGAVGHSAGATAKADGYTITMATFELNTMHRMGISELTYEDFTPLMQVNTDAAALIVKQDAPWKTLQEFMDYIRKNPGKLQMSGTGAGGAWDLARAGFQNAAGIPVSSVVWIPTKGSAPSLLELMGGHIDAVCCSIPEASSQIESGVLRVLAVMSAERHPDHPDVPTVKESGVDWEAVGWRGLMLPKGAPDEIVNQLTQKLEKILTSEAYIEFMNKFGYGITVRGPAEFKSFLGQQDEQWKSVIEAVGYDKK